MGESERHNRHCTTSHSTWRSRIFESEKKRLEDLGLEVEAVDHAWVHLRSMYFPDPEGNMVELLAYDESIGEKVP